MSTKRASTLPKPTTSIRPTAVISDVATLSGSHLITIGDNTVLHPRCKINAANAEVTIGKACIIGERCSIGLSELSDTEIGHVTIGDYVVVEPGAVVEANQVGTGTLIEVYAKIGKRSSVGKVQTFRIVKCNAY